MHYRSAGGTGHLQEISSDCVCVSGLHYIGTGSLRWISSDVVCISEVREELDRFVVLHAAAREEADNAQKTILELVKEYDEGLKQSRALEASLKKLEEEAAAAIQAEIVRANLPLAFLIHLWNLMCVSNRERDAAAAM